MHGQTIFKLPPLINEHLVFDRPSASASVDLITSQLTAVQCRLSHSLTLGANNIHKNMYRKSSNRSWALRPLKNIEASFDSFAVNRSAWFN